MMKYRLHSVLKNGKEIQIRNLMNIIKKDCGTSYGRKYDFCSISHADEFRSRVPLTTYEDYSRTDWSELSPVCILETSGTTGMQKEFALTQEALDHYSSYIYDRQYELAGSDDGPHLHMSVFRPAENGKTLLSAAYYTYLKDSGKMDCGSYAGGEKLMFTGKTENLAYIRSFTALCCRNLKSLQSIFLYDILLMCGYIEENWKMLISDMRERRFSVHPDEETENELLRLIPDEGIADELEKLFTACDGHFSLDMIWKELRFISGIGGETFRIQDHALKKYAGDIPVCYFAYASSECMAGAAVEMNRSEYILLPESAFYEFTDEHGEVLLPWQVSPGEVYELVVTTFSGLYRYRTGDLLEITDMKGEMPVFRVKGRTDNIINIAGEKIDEKTARDAVTRWSQITGISADDFAVGKDLHQLPGRYAVFICPESDISEEDERCLESVLEELSPDYRDVRNLGMLRSLKIFTRDRIIRGDGEKSHSKPSVFLSDTRTEKNLKYNYENSVRKTLEE